MVRTIACGDCLTPVCFEDQIVTECSALVTKVELFVQVRIEFGADAGFVLLVSGYKISCTSRSKRSAKILEEAMCRENDILTRLERASRKRRYTLLQFANQQPGDMLYVPHLSFHSVLTPYLGTTTILAGWDCCTKEDTELITRLLNDFCPGALR